MNYVTSCHSDALKRRPRHCQTLVGNEILASNRHPLCPAVSALFGAYVRILTMMVQIFHQTLRVRTPSSISIAAISYGILTMANYFN